MEQTEKSLEDYKITSPINGTVITKNSKAGDTIDKTNSATTMMVVADVSRLKFELAIDELDVEKVTEGQEVMITCDALPGEEFTGIITNVSVEGTATNGVTTYTAEVEIPEPGNLRPSMNVDASIIVESASDVLMIPTADITTMGDRSFVFVKGKAATNENKKASKDNDKMQRDGAPDDMNPEEGMNPPEGMTPPEGDMPEQGDMPDGENMSRGGGKDKGSMMPQAPDGYTTVEIQVGIASEDYTEVISGLSEGQEIYSKQTSSSSSDSMMPNMGGGMGGGMSMGGGMGGGPGGGGGMGGGPGGGMR